MKKEEVLKRSEQALSNLAESLKAGKSEDLQQYLRFLSRFHNYSFGNIMLIFSQRPDATHVAGFHTWKKLGRTVRKGEKGIGIIAPMIGKRQDDDTHANDETEKVVRGFRVAHVFDVTQTDGDALPGIATVVGEPKERLARLREIVAAEGISLRYESHLEGALGLSKGGEIIILSELEPAREFSVMAHELAHELLHRGARRKETTKTVRETEAEAVAYAVCTAVGLDCSTMSADYIQLYSGDAETLQQSLDFIQRTAARILTALETTAEDDLAKVA